jgi:hypothetical protein
MSDALCFPPITNWRTDTSILWKNGSFAGPDCGHLAARNPLQPRSSCVGGCGRASSESADIYHCCKSRFWKITTSQNKKNTRRRMTPSRAGVLTFRMNHQEEKLQHRRLCTFNHHCVNRLCPYHQYYFQTMPVGMFLWSVLSLCVANGARSTQLQASLAIILVFHRCRNAEASTIQSTNPLRHEYHETNESAFSHVIYGNITSHIFISEYPFVQTSVNKMQVVVPSNEGDRRFHKIPGTIPQPSTRANSSSYNNNNNINFLPFQR